MRLRALLSPNGGGMKLPEVERGSRSAAFGPPVQLTYLSSAIGHSQTGVQTLPGLMHTGGSPTRRDGELLSG